MVKNQKQRSVQLHDFAMTPSPEVPRSAFNLSHGKKIAFNFSDLVPILCEMAIPGDTWTTNFNINARTAVPIVPIQDNWRINFFSFFVPMRLVWDNAPKFWGEQTNPGDSTNYTIPQCAGVVGGYPIGTLFDYFGLPTLGQWGAGNAVSHNALPLRAYNRIYNEWFRDENLQNSVPQITNDGVDAYASYGLLQRGKRFDYITQALPWPQKGNTAISLPIGVSAPIKTSATELVTTGTNPAAIYRRSDNNAFPSASPYVGVSPGAGTMYFGPSSAGGALTLTSGIYPTNLWADLAGATGTTLNAFRTAVTMQQYLERDARMGTRYTEFVWGMFKVRTADARLNRPEFIGGGQGEILTTAIPQTSATGLTGGTTPAGNLAASGFAGGGGGFTYSVTEHGYLLTLACATADITYQQGLRKMWTVSTRYDFPVPLLANLGEQALLNKEVYADGSAADNNVFGYVPRWDEYRSIPSSINGIYRSTAAGTLDYWHTSQKFTALPTLNSTFITDAAKTVVQRNFVAGATTLGQQLLADLYFNIRCTRALPLYGIPGLTRL